MTSRRSASGSSGTPRSSWTSGTRAAADVLAELGARAAIPIHWGTLYPRRLHRVWRAPLHAPGDRFAAHAHETAPDADVRVLRPGESTVFTALGD